MYTPTQFKVDRKEVLHTLIRQHPFGALVTCGEIGPSAAHIPFVLHDEISSKFINAMIKGFLGVEIKIDRIQGK